MTVNLHPGWYNPDFTGFAVCALTRGYETAWESCFTTEHGEIIAKSHQPVSMKSWTTNNYHVVMQSFPVDCRDVSGATQVSFRVSKYSQTQVRKCGVRLLYRQDVEEFQRCKEENFSHLAFTPRWSSGETQQQKGKGKSVWISEEDE